MYLSYLIKTRFGQSLFNEWHTVKVSECGKLVENKQGVKVGIGPFLILEHKFHEKESDAPKQ